MSLVDRRRRQSVATLGARRSSVHSSVVGSPNTNNIQLPADIQVGARVIVHGENSGVVRYAGSTSFQTGKWVGVELDEPVGKNSGVVQGKRYFDCKPNHGVFVRPIHVTILPVNEKSKVSSPRSDRNSDAPQKPQQDPGRTVRGTAARRSTIHPQNDQQQQQPLAKRRASMAASAAEATSRATRVPKDTTATATRRPASYAASPTRATMTPTAAKSTTPTAATRATVTPTNAKSVRPTAATRATMTPSSAKSTAAKSSNATTVSRASTINTTTTLQRRKSMYMNEKTQNRPRSNTVAAQAEAEAAEAARAREAKEARERQLAKLRQRQEQEREKEREQEREQELEQERLALETEQQEEQEREQEQDQDDESCSTASPEDTEEDSSDKDIPTTPADQEDVMQHGESSIKQPETAAAPVSQTHEQRPQASYGALAATMPISKSDQFVPLKDYEELRFKLKILEAKRQEDRERYREHEKIKEEAEQFLTLRNKLQDKIAELQKDLRDSKRELKETAADKEALEQRYIDLADNLEMMTLDKEVAEERAEALQEEVDFLKEKMEEISVDLDILKKEADVMNRVPETGDEERAPLEVVQLERHNERLREALIRLRDVTNEQEAELNQKIKELEEENYELSEIKVQYEKVSEKLEAAESLIEDLRQRLDDAMAAEDLVEQLTEKNLALTEKVEELQSAVDDLEALKDLADELEENHVETEKQLQAEIDHRDMLLREQLERIRASEETNLDYENTIQQFRELVQHLQSDLEHLRSKQEQQQTENVNLSSQSQSMMSLNMQLQSTVMKAQAKAIDLELRKLEAAQANDRLSYIQPYLPEAFFKTENDPISCLLLFKRLVFKAELVIKHLDQNHPISEKIMENVSESLVAVCEMRQKAAWLSDLAKRFVTFIRHCSPEVFSKMAQVYQDLIGSERRLNAIVELFRTDNTKESECLLDLHRIIGHLEHLAEIYLGQTSETGNVDLFYSLTRALDMNADKMVVELTFVKQLVENAIHREEIPVAEGMEHLEYQYLLPLGQLITETKSSKLTAKKMLRQLDDLSEQALTPKAEHLHRFRTMYALSTKLSQFCLETLKQILVYIDVKRGSREEISLAKIQQIVYVKSDEILDISETSMWDGCYKVLKSLTSELATTLKRVENDTRMDKIATSVPPWIQRASDMKAEVLVNRDMERKLQQHNEEIMKLVKDIKAKDQALQESFVKVEILERRMEVARKEVENVHLLEDNLEKAKAQTQMYSEAMENLQTEYEALERENAQLKKSLAAQKEEKRFSYPQRLLEVEEASESSSEHDDLGDIHAQMETLKAGIRYLRAENAHLKSCDLARSLKLDLDPVQPSVEQDNTDSNAVKRSIAMETRTLIKEMRKAAASPRVVTLSGERDKQRWQSIRKAPDYQYQAQQSVLYTLKQRSEQLKHKARQFEIEKNGTNRIRPLETVLPQSIGKIQIPCLANTTSRRHCIQLGSAIEFERIHGLFIR